MRSNISYYLLSAFVCFILMSAVGNAMAQQCGGKDYHICLNNAADTAKLKSTGHSISTAARESIIWHRFDASSNYVPVARDTQPVLSIPIDSVLLNHLEGLDTATYYYTIVRDTQVTRDLHNLPSRPAFDTLQNYYGFVNAGERFKVAKQCTLNKVMVYALPDTIGIHNHYTMTITLQDTLGNNLYSATDTNVGINGRDSFYVNLDFPIIDTTKEYQLVAKGSKVQGLIRNSSATYSYGEGSLLTINGPTINPANHYYFFYKWNLSYDSLITVCTGTANLIMLKDSLVQRQLDNTGTGNVTICNGATKIIDATMPGYANTTYHWLDGGTTNFDTIRNPKYFQVGNTINVVDDTLHHSCIVTGHLQANLFPAFNVTIDSIASFDCGMPLDSTLFRVFASVDDTLPNTYTFLWKLGATVKDSVPVTGTNHPSQYRSSTDSIATSNTSLNLTVTNSNTGCVATKNGFIQSGLKTLKLVDSLQISLYICSGNPSSPIDIRTTGGFGAVKYLWDSQPSALGLADSTSPFQPHLHVGKFPFTVSDKSNCPIRDTVQIVPKYGPNSLGHDQLGFTTYTASDSTIWSAITIFDRTDLDTLYANYAVTGISLAINHPNNDVWGSAVVRIRENIQTDGNIITDLGKTVFETNLITFDDFFTPFSCLGVPDLNLDQDSSYAIEVQISPYNSKNVLGLDDNQTVANKGGWLLNYKSPNGTQLPRGNWNIRATFTDKAHVGISEITTVDDKVRAYPNPTTGITNVAFDVNHAQRVSIYVTDLLGTQLIKVLDNEQLTEGNHQVQINASALPAGIYTIVLHDENGIAGKKMVLIK